MCESLVPMVHCWLSSNTTYLTLAVPLVQG
jgi:hypothetical protein